MTARRRLALLALSIGIAGICVALGVWQGRRLASRRAANEAARNRRALPVVYLNQPGAESDLTDRRVSATGTYDHANTVILRGRLEREVPGVFLATPLRLDGTADAVLVLRGFVPAADAMRPDPSLIDNPDRAAVEGIAFPVPASADSGAPVAVSGLTSWRRLDLPALRRRIPYPLLAVYLHAVADDRAVGRSDGQRRPFPRPASLPPLDDGPHLSYMIQWFGIAVVALAFGILYGRAGGRADRRAATKSAPPD